MDHAATMRRPHDRLSTGDIDGFGDVLADDFVEHEEFPGLPATKDGAKALFKMLRSGFPDMQMTPQDIIVSGDKAVARVQLTGTQQDEMMGVPATGKSVKIQLIDIMRLGEDGLVHEHWSVMDQMTMMQQLGVVPAGPPA